MVFHTSPKSCKILINKQFPVISIRYLPFLLAVLSHGRTIFNNFFCHHCNNLTCRNYVYNLYVPCIISQKKQVRHIYPIADRMLFLILSQTISHSLDCFDIFLFTPIRTQLSPQITYMACNAIPADRYALLNVAFILANSSSSL